MSGLGSAGPFHVGAPGVIVSADGQFITSVPRGKGAGASVRRDVDTALLAASHALLVALEAIAEGHQDLTWCILAARAAIAKAGAR